MARVRPVAYLDADIILHRAVSFCTSSFDGERIIDHKSALNFFDIILKKWLKEVGPIEDYFLVLSVGGNFRKSFFPEYKMNRKDIVPHPAFKALKEEVMEFQGSVWEEGIEADDLIGIRCTESANTIAVSADKDFATIPCNLLIPASHGKTQGERFTFTEADANLNWMRQAMMGDTVDNYKGIPGCGAVKAGKVLPETAPLPYLWHHVRKTFLDAKLTEQDALTMVRLARILRAGDYDFETKEVKLWKPISSR